MVRRCLCFAGMLVLWLGMVRSQAAHIVAGCIGDFGGGGAFEANVARLVKSWKPGLIITVGDNNYPSGEQETIDANAGRFYHQFIAPYQGTFGAGAVSNCFFPSLGNHDWMTPGARPYLRYFTLPGNERYYTFTYGPVHFFCADSDPREPHGATSGSIQGQWLKAELAASTSAWRVVYFHHAPYSSGSWHGDHTRESEHMRWPFKAWGAHVVLAGHDHVYERLRVDGLTYFVNGLGGDSFDPFYAAPARGSVKRFTGDFGALRLDATETNLTFRFITVRQQVVDTHLLLKPAAAPRVAPLNVSYEVIAQ